MVLESMLQQVTIASNFADTILVLLLQQYCIEVDRRVCYDVEATSSDTTISSHHREYFFFYITASCSINRKRVPRHTMDDCS